MDIYRILHHEAFLIIGNSTVAEESEWLSSNADRMKDAFVAAGIPGFERTAEGKAASDCLREFTTNVLARAKQRAADLKATATTSQSSTNGTAKFDDAVGVDTADAFASNSVAAKLLSKHPDGTDVVDDQLKHDQLMNFMFAGHETTANTMSWCMYELMKNQDVQAKLQLEIDAMWAKKKATPKKGKASAGAGVGAGPESLEQLSYRDLQVRFLTKVINETLRLHNVTVSVPFRFGAHSEQ